MPDIPRVLSTSTVFTGRLFSVELAELEMPGGLVTRRESIRHPGAVAMVPVTDAGELLLVTQYRHAAGKRLLEIPAGTLEPGEEPIATVARELQEEVGMFPGRIESLGGIYVAPGYTSEYVWLYVCSELRPARLDGDEDEDIEVTAVSPEGALEMIESGAICDAKTVAGILRWHRTFNR